MEWIIITELFAFFVYLLIRLRRAANHISDLELRLRTEREFKVIESEELDRLAGIISRQNIDNRHLEIERDHYRCEVEVKEKERDMLLNKLMIQNGAGQN